MLTDLQREIRRILTGLAECDEFALAGGAAIIVNGIADRPTNDLDFFTSYPKTVEALLNAAQTALEDEGLDVARLAERTTFARLSVSSADEMTYVDLASDARMLPAQATEEGFVLAEPESDTGHRIRRLHRTERMRAFCTTSPSTPRPGTTGAPQGNRAVARQLISWG